MRGEKPSALLSDGRFYYRCSLKNLSDTEFTACDLPQDYNDKEVAEISLIVRSNLTLKMNVMVDSIKISPEKGKKDIVFRISDPPVLWKTYVNNV